MATETIPYLRPKPSARDPRSWHWEPSRVLAAAGWVPIPMGTDREAAFAAARAQNKKVDEWRTGGARPREIARMVKAQTLGAGIRRYRAERLWDKKLSLAENRREGRVMLSTSKAYSASLDRIDYWAGDQPIDWVTPARVAALRRGMMQPEARGGIGHHAAYATLKTLRTVFEYLITLDLVPKGMNPASKFGLGPPPARRALWEANHEGAFIAAAYALGKPSMALAIKLAIYTAQRESDLIGFTEHHYREIELFDPEVERRLAGDDNKVRGWVMDEGQAKTSDEYAATVMEIPFDPVMRAEVERAIAHNRAIDRAKVPPRLVTHVLVDDRTGAKWTNDAFIRAWREVLHHAAKETGMVRMLDLHWHDLKRTRVVRLRRRKFTVDQIAALTGTSPASIYAMLKVYGPVDPTMTAGVIAADIEQTEARAARAVAQQERAKG